MTGFISFILLTAAPKPSLYAQTLLLLDSELEEITAQGNVVIGGDFSFNDNHQFDSSDHKGSIDMTGTVMTQASSTSILISTQSAVASSVNVLGDISASNATINITSNNEATNFIGGF